MTTSGPNIAYLLADPGIPVGGTKGASVHVESLCAAMARAGARVTLYAAKVTGPLQARGSETVRVVPVDFGPVRSGPAGERTRIAAAGRFYESVGRLLEADRPDWVHERLSLFAGRGGELCAAQDLGRVVEVNAPVAAERLRHFGLERADEAHDAELAALQGARVLAVSQPLAEWALATGASEALVVPNGADTTALDPVARADDRIEVRRRLGFAERVVVGFAGSLKPWHGVEVLLEALAATPSGHPVGLLIVGDGPGRAATELAAKTLPASVTPVVTGAVPFADMPGWLAAMDISVAPYLPADTFYFSPLKVAEAMAAGLAVVASDFPPVRELLGATGVLLAPGDTTQLGAAIDRLVTDADARIRLGALARTRALRHLDWDVVAARTLAFSADHPCSAATTQGRL